LAAMASLLDGLSRADKPIEDQARRDSRARPSCTSIFTSVW
jgi:hypothetical protein